MTPRRDDNRRIDVDNLINERFVSRSQKDFVSFRPSFRCLWFPNFCHCKSSNLIFCAGFFITKNQENVQI